MFRLLPCLCFCKWCYSELWDARILLDHVFLWIYAQEWECKVGDYIIKILTHLVCVTPNKRLYPVYQGTVVAQSPTAICTGRSWRTAHPSAWSQGLRCRGSMGGGWAGTRLSLACLFSDLT